MGAPFADLSNVEDIWRPVTSEAEANRVSARLDEASQMIRDETPLVGGLTVDQRLAAGTLSAETVRFIVVAMVERMVLPGRYVRQESTSVDDGTVSRTIDNSVSAGGMFIAPDEMRRLMGLKKLRRGAFTITPGAGQPWICATR